MSGSPKWLWLPAAVSDQYTLSVQRRDAQRPAECQIERDKGMSRTFGRWKQKMVRLAWKKHATTVVIWACLCAMAVAQDGPFRRHKRFIEALKTTAADITDQALVDVKTLDDWKRLRPKLRREFLYTMGLDPLPKRTPLEVQVTGTLARPGYRIEKIVFQSMPGLYVTGNLYVPRSAEHSPEEALKPMPTILYVCGHSPHPLGAKWNYQDRVLWYVEHGFVCFVIDTLEFAEVAGIHHGLHDLNMWHWLSRGYTPAGVEVWNATRAIDYLETRDEVDANRIGITGISGGGAVSWYAAAADERIAVSVPVCGTFSFGSQAKHWRASGQCDCIYYHNTFLTDQSVVAALIAPRPLLICSGQLDADFPPDGYHNVFQRAKRVYDMVAESDHKPSRIREVDEAVGHTDSPLFRREARQWMNRWLRDVNVPIDVVPNPTDKPSTPEELKCLTRLPADAINYRIDQLLIPTAVPKDYNELPKWTVRRKEMLAELRDKSFRWFPKSDLPLNVSVNRNRGGWASRYAEYKDVEIQTEPGVPIRVQLLRARNRSAETPLLIYAKRPGDSIYFLDIDELLPVLGRCDVAILNPRMTEHSVSAADYADIERTAAWIGRTIASMQVWDILRTVEWLGKNEKVAPALVSVYGKGDMGIVALYAALLDDRIDQVILRDPPASHRRGPALLNVLRITDIPEATAALAPRKLVFIGDDVPFPFRFATTIYKLHGQADQITSSPSLPEALEIWKY